MQRASLILAVTLALLLAACGGSGRTTSQAPSTPAALATLDVVRTGGIAASRQELHLAPDDPRLQAAEDALGVPLPPSVATSSTAADAFVYRVTAVLTDGTSATYAFDEGDVPRDLDGLRTWLGTAM
jgi:hypothetical protein